MERAENWPTKIVDDLKQKLIEIQVSVEKLKAENTARELGLSLPSNTSVRSLYGEELSSIDHHQSPPLSDTETRGPNSAIDAISSLSSLVVLEPVQHHVESSPVQASQLSSETTILCSVNPSPGEEQAFYRMVSRDIEWLDSDESLAAQSGSDVRAWNDSDFVISLRDAFAARSTSTMHNPDDGSGAHIGAPARRDFATEPNNMTNGR